MKVIPFFFNYNFISPPLRTQAIFAMPFTYIAELFFRILEDFFFPFFFSVLVVLINWWKLLSGFLSHFQVKEHVASGRNIFQISRLGMCVIMGMVSITERKPLRTLSHSSIFVMINTVYARLLWLKKVYLGPICLY